MKCLWLGSRCDWPKFLIAWSFLSKFLIAWFTEDKKVAIPPYYLKELIVPLIFVAQSLSWFLDQLFEKVRWSPGSVWSRLRALWQAAHKWLHLACGQETVYLNQLMATLIPHLPSSFVEMTPRHCWRLPDMLSRTVMLWTSISDAHRPLQRRVRQ